jgi:hypothetical protein
MRLSTQLEEAVEPEKENYPMERKSFLFWPSATALRTTGLAFVAACSMLMSPGARADKPVIVIFDAPGVPIPPVAGPNVGTATYSINPEGAVAGYYSDANAVVHGFIRSPGGRFTIIDVPGAGTLTLQGTYTYNINAAGAVAGDYIDSNGVSHTFVRLADGTTNTFDVPGAGTSSGQGTFPCTIDCLTADGSVAGDYADANGVFHAFVRSPNGAITTFDAPGAGTAAGQGTFPAGLNSSGTIEGSFVDINGTSHGFVRAANGVIAPFDVAGAVGGTFPANINSRGSVVGYYVDAGSAYHAFVRSESGTIQTFDVPNAGTAAFQGTAAVCNNPSDVIVGSYYDANGFTHGYSRSPDGKITTFDAVPGSFFTAPLAVNPSGEITGGVIDPNHYAVLRGFLRLSDE